MVEERQPAKRQCMATHMHKHHQCSPGLAVTAILERYSRAVPVWGCEHNWVAADSKRPRDLQICKQPIEQEAAVCKILTLRQHLKSRVHCTAADLTFWDADISLLASVEAAKYVMSTRLSG